MMLIELDTQLREHLPAQSAFDWLLNCAGIEHRHVKHRRTVEFEIGGKRYFIKIHRGCGWREIFKDLFQLRPPIVSARNEWEAIGRLQKLGVRTFKIAGKGLRGKNPARRESFLITEAMDGMISLENFPKSFQLADESGRGGARCSVLLKRALLEKIAHISRALHENGMNHRDFYLCHFLVKDRDWKKWRPDDELDLVLIDLHRAQIRPRVPERWLVKDLGGLLFSAMDCGLTQRDLLRFVKIYSQQPLQDGSASEQAFWRRVLRNARKLYRDFHKKEPPSLSSL